MTTTPLLEAVYYASPIPRWKGSLTLMGLVFDKIHFPFVYLPSGGYDPVATARAAELLAAHPNPARKYEADMMVGVLRTLPHVEHLKTFCEFTGDGKQLFIGDTKEAGAVVELLVWASGIRFAPNFTHTPTIGHFKDLPGGESVDYPGPWHYPALALLYAKKHGIPLINDDPGMPVPGMGGDDVKHNAQLLASLLAMKCVEFALPTVPPLTPAQIVEMREHLKPHLQPFRSSMFQLSGKLNAMLASDATDREIEAVCTFIVDTEVRPAMSELEAALQRPAILTMTNAVTAAVAVPAIAAAATVSTSGAVAAGLSALGLVLNNVRTAKSEAARSGMYYLLEARRRA